MRNSSPTVSKVYEFALKAFGLAALVLICEVPNLAAQIYLANGVDPAQGPYMYVNVTDTNYFDQDNPYYGYPFTPFGLSFYTCTNLSSTNPSYWDTLYYGDYIWLFFHTSSRGMPRQKFYYVVTYSNDWAYTDSQLSATSTKKAAGQIASTNQAFCARLVSSNQAAAAAAVSAAPTIDAPATQIASTNQAPTAKAGFDGDRMKIISDQLIPGQYYSVFMYSGDAQHPDASIKIKFKATSTSHASAIDIALFPALKEALLKSQNLSIKQEPAATPSPVHTAAKSLGTNIQALSQIPTNGIWESR